MALSNSMINVFARVVERKAEESDEDLETLVEENYPGLEQEDVDEIINKIEE